MLPAFPSRPPVTAPPITGRRAEPRARLFVPAKVMLLQGLEKCLLDDLSQQGARVTLSAHMLRPGAGAVLQIKGIDAFGTVVWVFGQRFGLRFDEVIPLAQVVSVRHFADAYAEHEAMISARNARDFVVGRPRLRSSR